MDAPSEIDVEGWLGARQADAGRPTARIASGTVIEDWKVVAFLGSGLSAEVYRVVNIRMGGDAALKLLVDGSRGLKERFVRETEAVRTLAITVLPRYFGSGEYDGRPYFIMEYLQPLMLPFARAREAADFVRALAKGVGELHEAGFIHRDIKPSNVLVRRNGEPALIDLGLVKPVASQPRPADSDVSVVDGRRVGVGTPGFAAPEQLIKGVADVRSDVFALGKLLRACCGEKVPLRLMKVVRTATSDDPDDRYPSARAFADALAARTPSDLWKYAAVVFLGAAVGALCFRSRPAAPAAPADRPPAADGAEVVSLARQPGETDALRLVRLLKLARQGVLDAKTAVAEAYFHGVGTETNLPSAVFWFTQAAKEGSPGAEASLGLCRLRGLGCACDREEGFAWLLRAARHGNLGGMNDVAFCYLHGIGVDQDRQEGFAWAMKAAERGHAGAQALVGECYLDGRGVETDLRRADIWLQRAARQGNARAQMLLRTR